MDEENHFTDLEEEADESYSFMSETVKKRPPRLKQLLAKAVMILCAGALFGAAAAFVFVRFSGFLSIPQEDEKVHIERDAEETAADTPPVTESPAAAKTPSVTETPSPAETPQITETPTPVPELKETDGPEDEGETSEERDDGQDPDGDGPEKTEEELNEEALVNYERLNFVMHSVAEEASRSAVLVTGITDTEDWFSNIHSASRTSSGLIVTENSRALLILVDGSVVEDAGRILVTLGDGSIAEGSLIKNDPGTGLSVILVGKDQLSGETSEVIRVADLGNSFDVRTGDSIIAIGSPLGYSNSVVYGEVTSTESHIQVTDGEYDLITTSCIGSASGSGALVNLDGDVVGFIMQKYTPENFGCVTAVPISLLKALIEKLANGEPIGYAGLYGESVTEAVAAEIDIPAGVYITAVDPDSPALSAGLMPGDVITLVGDTPAGSMRTVYNRILAAEPGAELSFTVLRRGAEGDVEFQFVVTIGERT